MDSIRRVLWCGASRGWANVVSEPSQDFAELLSRARIGDKSAMEQLVREYEPEVRLVARVRLGAALRPYLDSVDLVQSVHRSLMMGLREDRFDISTPEKLIALALTIVRRKVARHWRHLRRQQRLSRGDGACPDGLPQLLVSLSSPDSDPQAVATLREQTERLLEKMDETERRIIELRLDGCTTAQAAHALGLDADVLRVRLSRLRRRFRELGLLAEWL
jgi:RNA polymerase sigma factor (sigma-70 family)